MQKTCKFSAAMLVVASLVAFSVMPALAYTYTTNGTTYYSTKSYNYSYGTYSTRQIYSKPTTPTTTQPTPAPVPTTPTKPTPAPTTPSTPAPAPTTPSTPAPAPQPSGTSLNAEESKMVNLVNQARMGQGIKPLSVNQQLVGLARLKSQDMVKNNYFGHTSPTYGSPFDMMKNNGVRYSTAGENLAGAATTETAHQNLMNSAGHRANILNGNFNQIGIGIASGSAYGNIYTQLFIGI